PPLHLALDVRAGVCAQPPLGRVDGVGIPLLRLLLLQPRLGVVHRRGLALDPAIQSAQVAHAARPVIRHASSSQLPGTSHALHDASRPLFSAARWPWSARARRVEAASRSRPTISRISSHVTSGTSSYAASVSSVPTSSMSAR